MAIGIGIAVVKIVSAGLDRRDKRAQLWQMDELALEGIIEVTFCMCCYGLANHNDMTWARR